MSVSDELQYAGDQIGLGAQQQAVVVAVGDEFERGVLRAGVEERLGVGRRGVAVVEAVEDEPGKGGGEFRGDGKRGLITEGDAVGGAATVFIELAAVSGADGRFLPASGSGGDPAGRGKQEPRVGGMAGVGGDGGVGVGERGEGDQGDRAVQEFGVCGEVEGCRGAVRDSEQDERAVNRAGRLLLKVVQERGDALGFAGAEGRSGGGGAAVAGEVGGKDGVAGFAEGLDPGAEGGLAGGVGVGVEDECEPIPVVTTAGL